MPDSQWWHITALVISSLAQCTFLIARSSWVVRAVMSNKHIFAISTFALLAACERGVNANSPSATVSARERRTVSWRAEAIAMLNERRCAGARHVLQGVPATQVTEDWYALRAMGEAACWSQSHAPAERQA